MALSQFETKKVEKVVAQFVEKHRPPQNIRNKLDLAFRVVGQSVEIFEVRPVWREPTKKMECAVAKATFVKTQRIWKVFWQRADLKWHGYEPCPEVARLEQFLALVEKDEYACFFG